MNAFADTYLQFQFLVKIEDYNFKNTMSTISFHGPRTVLGNHAKIN